MRGARGHEARTATLKRSLDRGRMYREVGADVLFIEALTSEAEAEEAVRASPGVPLLFD